MIEEETPAVILEETPAVEQEPTLAKQEPTEAQKAWWMAHHGGVDDGGGDTRLDTRRGAPVPETLPEGDTRVMPESTAAPSTESTPGFKPRNDADSDVDAVTMKRLEEAAVACSAAFPKKGKSDFPEIIKSHLLEMHRKLNDDAAPSSTVPATVPTNTVGTGETTAPADTVTDAEVETQAAGASSSVSDEEKAIAAEDAAVAKAMEEESAAYNVQPGVQPVDTRVDGEIQAQPETGTAEPETTQDHSGSYPDVQQTTPQETTPETTTSETTVPETVPDTVPETSAEAVSGSADDMSGLREELKAELKAELKEQLKQELMEDMVKEAGGGAPQGVVGAARK